MSARRLIIVIALLGLAHNGLRVLASLFGARWGFFNYLQPFQWKPVNASNLPQIAGLIAVFFVVGFVARWSWRKPDGGSSTWWCALWAASSGAALGLLGAYVSLFPTHTYGWTLFVIIPALVGFQATITLAYGQPITLGNALVVSMSAVLLLGVLLLLVAIEGAICLLMALPIAIPLAMLGGLAGYALRRKPAANNPVTFLLLIGLAPFGAPIEHALQPSPEVFAVSTSIDLPFAPERVWRTVLEPARLAPPAHPLFRAGVAYPLASHIEGAGLTATRYCDFSTGKLVEPVLIWYNLHRLRFRVASNPLPMQEWTPYARIHPPHLDGFLVSRQGEFQLEAMPNGGTRLKATTWYQHGLWPARYWKLWSDYIIHNVHAMVLENIRARSKS